MHGLGAGGSIIFGGFMARGYYNIIKTELPRNFWHLEIKEYLDYLMFLFRGQ